VVEPGLQAIKTFLSLKRPDVAILVIRQNKFLIEPPGSSVAFVESSEHFRCILLGALHFAQGFKYFVVIVRGLFTRCMLSGIPLYAR
jgi:hypothetical protein